MRRFRQMLAITLVATALCADRAAVAAPVLRPQVASAASRFVSRLSARFHRVVSAIRVYQNQTGDVVAAQKTILVSDATACFRTRLSPLLLRLPPPLV
ncbi:MAG TPA: hypothetical protein VKK61_01495 [Tepidisphaeraceae bacterium]|nr:hypothetical protein [Tepidisphaeraceae bacterium]